MIFLNKDNFSDEDFNFTEKEKEFLNYNIAIQKKKKEFILNTMEKIAASTKLVETSCVSHMLSVLEHLKNSLQLCNENLSALDNYINNIDNVVFSIQNHSHDFDNILKTFNTDYSELSQTILDNTLKIETYLYTVFDSDIMQASLNLVPSEAEEENNIVTEDADESKVEEIFEQKENSYVAKADEIFAQQVISAENSVQPEQASTKHEEVNIPTEQVTTVSVPTEKVSPIQEKTVQIEENTIEETNYTDFDLVPQNDDKMYIENTLTVSEALGRVTLPYSLADVKEILEKHPDKYTSIDNVITKKYTLPISNFKNASVSRFKEAYKLIRHKEHGSVADGFELGLELMFNYNLHPAIIAACKNLDELDIYLDYLDNGEINKFKCFKVIFDLPPVISKNKKKGVNLL